MAAESAQGYGIQAACRSGVVASLLMKLIDRTVWGVGRLLTEEKMYCHNKNKRFAVTTGEGVCSHR